MQIDGVKSDMSKARTRCRKSRRRARVRVGLSRKFGVIPHHDSQPHASTTMDGEAPVDDVFSSDQLWKQSTLFTDSALYESALFAPLQLDSEFVACLHLQRVHHH